MKLNTLKIYMHMAHTKKPKVSILEKFDLQKGIHKLEYAIYSPKNGFNNVRIKMDLFRPQTALASVLSHDTLNVILH